MGRRLTDGRSGARLSASGGRARHPIGVGKGPTGRILLFQSAQSCKEFVGRFELHELHEQSDLIKIIYIIKIVRFSNLPSSF